MDNLKGWIEFRQIVYKVLTKCWQTLGNLELVWINLGKNYFQNRRVHWWTVHHCIGSVLFYHTFSAGGNGMMWVRGGRAKSAVGRTTYWRQIYKPPKCAVSSVHPNNLQALGDTICDLLSRQFLPHFWPVRLHVSGLDPPASTLQYMICSRICS